MKILQVIPYFAWEYGGPVRVVHDLSVKLAEKGHEVSIYTTDVGIDGRLQDKYKIKFKENVNVEYFNCSNNWIANNFKLHLSNSMLFKIKKNLKNFDLVHLHEWRGIPHIYIWYYARKYGIPYIIQGHGSSPKLIGNQKKSMTFLKSIFNKIFEDRLIKGASKLIAINNQEFDQYTNFGVEKNKIEIIENSIDASEYENLPVNGNFRRKYGIKNEEKIILYLGRIDSTKGINILLESFKDLTFEMENVKLVIVGPDHGYLSTLKNLIRKFHITDKVDIIGPLYGTDKLEAYVDSNLLVYPSYYEIFGLVPLESLLCGTPVIVTDNCGCSDLINSLGCGYIVKYGDIIDLKEKMKFIITHERKYERLIIDGSKFIIKNLNFDQISKKFENIYYELNEG
ncbi:glycosyltransferase [Methanobacterium sp.]|uniref:glycosyltransferase n=1 Tax=Methanobacterium sp. TaxID=2164 RepID=UPI003159090D